MPGSSSWMPYAPKGVKGFDSAESGTWHVNKGYRYE